MPLTETVATTFFWHPPQKTQAKVTLKISDTYRLVNFMTGTR